MRTLSTKPSSIIQCGLADHNRPRTTAYSVFLSSGRKERLLQEGHRVLPNSKNETHGDQPTVGSTGFTADSATSSAVKF